MRLRRWSAVAIGGLALSGLALVSCGDDDDDDIDDVLGATETAGSGSDETATGTSGGDTSGQVPAGAPLIEQEDLQFNPDELEVSSGETVYFMSLDTALHTVNVNGQNESGDMHQGDVFEWDPPRAGEYEISCDFHPDMQATITVD
ncbi:MAG: cupredoxin domain-containing protein [Tepidiformaceae bacterium]